MTWFESLDALLDDHGDSPLPVLLERVVSVIPDGPERRGIITELMDESRAAWQWLLAGSRRGTVLQLWGGWNADTLALARVWDQVTVLEPSPTAQRLLTRRVEAAGLHNVQVVEAGNPGGLPFADHVFDAVCLKVSPYRPPPGDAVVDSGGMGPLLTEIVRVLAPSGEVYLGLPNRWHRGLRKGGGLARRYDLTGVRRQLRAAGLVLHSLHAHETQYEEARFFVDLNDKRAIRAFQARHPGRGRHLPAWIYRRTAPLYSIVAGPGPAEPGWLADALAAARRHVEADGPGWTVEPAAVNRKGKLVTSLQQDGELRWIIKIPLNPEIQAGMDVSQRILTRLTADLSPDNPLYGLLPGHLARLDHGGNRLYLESACRGRPWSDIRDQRPGPGKTNLADVLAQLGALDAADFGFGPQDDRRSERLTHHAELLTRQAPELTDILQIVRDRLAAYDDAPLRLRKGDMTLGNVFLDGRRISGLIDWDETEATRLPLAAYADLLFSWLWRVEHLSRAEGLALLVSEDIGRLPAALAVPETLARLGADRRELADAALCSWLDHTYHELKHPVFRYQPERLRGLLIEPCRALARTWSGSQPLSES